MGNCPRCSGVIFPDNGTGEGVCLCCGCRLYDGRPAHPPSMEDKGLDEFDQLPYVEQVRILRERRKQPEVLGLA